MRKAVLESWNFNVQTLVRSKNDNGKVVDMRGIPRKSLVFLLLIIVQSFSCAFSAEKLDVAYDLPVMVVTQGGRAGKLVGLPFRIERTANGTPLRVLISNDAAAGASDTAQSSVWMAAMAAVVNRNDALSGVRITMEYSDFMDGPSAGAVTCLAILSALDGRAFPDDFAMTGTIMPDGTVGCVGGVHLKLRAAIAAGKRRFCIPAVRRFEQNAAGVFEDLLTIGAEQGVEILPVWNVDEAYAFAHRLPVQPKSVNREADVLRLPPAVEKTLSARCEHLARRWDACRKKLGDAAVAALRKQPFLRPILFDESFLRYYLSGRLLVAENRLSSLVIAWETAGEWMRRVNEVNARFQAFRKDPPFSEADRADYRASLAKLGEEQLAHFRLAAGENAVPAGRRGSGFSRTDLRLSLLTAQECCESEDIATTLGMWLWTDARASGWRKKASVPDKELVCCHDLAMLEEFMRMMRLKERELDLASERAKQLYADVSSARPGPCLDEFGRVFLSAQYAMGQAHERMFVDYAKAKDMDAMRRMFVDRDFHYASYFWQAQRAVAAGQLMKSLPADGLKDAEFHRAVQLVLGARTFARGSAHLLKFGIDVGQWENGAFVCKDANFLGFLVRRARETALSAIAECRKAGVFCPAAILDFQLADGYDVTSGGSDCVIHDVLERYWSAGLTAKALLMGFNSSKTKSVH